MTQEQDYLFAQRTLDGRFGIACSGGNGFELIEFEGKSDKIKHWKRVYDLVETPFSQYEGGPYSSSQIREVSFSEQMKSLAFGYNPNKRLGVNATLDVYRSGEKAPVRTENIFKTIEDVFTEKKAPLLARIVFALPILILNKLLSSKNDKKLYSESAFMIN